MGSGLKDALKFFIDEDSSTSSTSEIMPVEEWLDFLEEPTQKIKCTCGGYKTYGAYSPAYHSDWCDYGRNK